jgi:hypothetical protein
MTDLSIVFVMFVCVVAFSGYLVVCDRIVR